MNWVATSRTPVEKPKDLEVARKKARERIPLEIRNGFVIARSHLTNARLRLDDAERHLDQLERAVCRIIEREIAE